MKISSEVYNVYGPSETTIWSTYHMITDCEITPIGLPISDTYCLVLDQNKNMAPVGCIGELFIGGGGVSEGYKNEKFNDRFMVINHRKMYKTGDIVKVNFNGYLEYIGRNDTQLKIRGKRVELSEIRNVLELYPLIKSAVVTVKQFNGSQHIIGYFTYREEISLEHLRDFLNEKLLIIPSFLIPMKRFPETSNGKLDYKQLPNPDQKFSFYKELEYTPPQSLLEEQLHTIWSKELNNDHISVIESFYNIGGDSVILMKFISTLQQEFDIKITPPQFIQNSTISKIAKLIENMYINK